MLKDRISYYKELEEMTDSTVLVYFTGDRPGFETQMGTDVYDMFVDQLEALGKVKRISLFLYSRGGNTSFAWSLCNLIRSYCKEYDVIIPNRAHSSATLISLGADKIIMTKQATLSSIDPSVNGPLNPTLPDSKTKASVSVESIKGFLQLAKDDMKIEDSCDNVKVLEILAKEIHPLVLGNVFRARSHIRMLARKLLEKHFNGESDDIDKITAFLCSDSWSHDYTINRNEAIDSLRLNVKKPDSEMYTLIKSIYDDISNELQLRVPYNPVDIIGSTSQANYICTRAIIESRVYGQFRFVTKGMLTKVNVKQDNREVNQIQDNRYFENWERGDICQ
ncbi:MAG: serine protease [Bacteroidetes bacterium]|nr:serine protease [Bacteroidota bacterium]